MRSRRSNSPCSLGSCLGGEGGGDRHSLSRMRAPDELHHANEVGRGCDMCLLGMYQDCSKSTMVIHAYTMRACCSNARSALVRLGTRALGGSICSRARSTIAARATQVSWSRRRHGVAAAHGIPAAHRIAARQRLAAPRQSAAAQWIAAAQWMAASGATAARGIATPRGIAAAAWDPRGQTDHRQSPDLRRPWEPKSRKTTPRRWVHRRTCARHRPWDLSFPFLS